MIRNESRLSRRPWPSGARTALSGVNDRLSEGGRWLHPTKGFRTISDKRMEATMYVAEIKARVFPSPKAHVASKYTPHQGRQECARRRRQMLTKKET
jgi:hypothetical protein